jgi:hypothetical protein
VGLITTVFVNIDAPDLAPNLFHREVAGYAMGMGMADLGPRPTDHFLELMRESEEKG